MTEEQIKQKAEAEADKVIIGSGMDRASVIHLKHLLVTMYIQGATEATKELKAQIEKIKKYIKACWVEENLNDYSSYITNSSDEFRDLVKELNDEVRNGR